MQKINDYDVNVSGIPTGYQNIIATLYFEAVEPVKKATKDILS